VKVHRMRQRRFNNSGTVANYEPTGVHRIWRNDSGRDYYKFGLQFARSAGDGTNIAQALAAAKIPVGNVHALARSAVSPLADSA
jgi:hypothetical protein